MTRTQLLPLLLTPLTVLACPDGTAGGDDAGPAQIDAGASADAGASDAGSPDAGRPSCADPFPGPGPVVTSDGNAGYFEELDALDLTSVVDVDMSGLPPGQRTLINFMLLRGDGDRVTAADIDAAGELGRAVAGAFVKGGGDDVDFQFLRRGLYQLYTCSRPLPPTLDDLKSELGDYSSWNERTVYCSAAKSADRRMRSRPDGQVFIAETLDDAGVVRETEVLFRTYRDDGHLDFAAYTGAGELTNRSTFATPISEVILAAPYACTTCHTDPVGARISLIDATGTGAGGCP